MFKKILKFILLGLLLILTIGAIAAYVYFKSTAPDYKGEIVLETLSSDATIKYDEYGIPHIYAENAQDAYRAFGYAHAQDRLFQMEMVRRVSSGTLAEILGDRLVKTDQFFRTLGIRRMAQKAADLNFSEIDADWKRNTLAYLEGVNAFVDHGATPLDFTILGMPKKHFEPTDIYCILGYMGLKFTRALREDPIMEKIRLRHGEKYLADWLLDIKVEDSLKIQESVISDLSTLVPHDIEAYLGEASIPLWYGSNGWVVSASRSKSGKPILANDTHIGISQPSVWYEAHITYPGFDFYGNHLAGIPFGIIGHTRDLGWGLTIFPFDGLDLYRERMNPDNQNQVWANDQWVDMEIQPEVIVVKDGEDVRFDRKVTRHGPIINDVVSELDSNEMNPISFWWGYNHAPTKNLEAIHRMNTAKNMQELKEGVALIDFIGLNVLYGDKEGNIAHWGAGRIPKRPAHVNPKFIMDGASGNDELLGFYDFSENPTFENPESGFVASGNEDMGMIGENYFHGYYCPPNRYNRIVQLLSKQEKWSQEEFKAIQLDEISNAHQQMSKELAAVLASSDLKLDQLQQSIITALDNWNGGYGLNQIEPVVFTKLVYHVMRNAMIDELGAEDFETMQGSFIYKGSLPGLLANDLSVWWDDITTENEKENRQDAVAKAFFQTLEELKNQLGEDHTAWAWHKVHTITHNHPLGAVKPLDRYFNVGPYPVSSGNDVPNKMMYTVGADGIYEVNSSPALRILLDFANVDASESINPTGQSGNVMSPHYKDQTEMFNSGIYRPQLMNANEIERNARLLLLKKGE
ncbi:MAG: penicillin acylase family protein [Bacteroidota bacterium]